MAGRFESGVALRESAGADGRASKLGRRSRAEPNPDLRWCRAAYHAPRPCHPATATSAVCGQIYEPDQFIGEPAKVKSRQSISATRPNRAVQGTTRHSEISPVRPKAPPAARPSQWIKSGPGRRRGRKPNPLQPAKPPLRACDQPLRRAIDARARPTNPDNSAGVLRRYFGRRTAMISITFVSFPSAATSKDSIR